MSVLATRIRPHDVDRLLELYCDWREECAEVWAAYDRLCVAARGDSTLVFAAYCAALEREGSAARAYAAQLQRVRS